MIETKKESELITKTLDGVFQSKTFKRSMYLLKYIYDKDEEYFDKFIHMFRKLKPEEQMQVMCNVRANLVEQGKLKEQKEENKIVEGTNRTFVRAGDTPKESRARLEDRLDDTIYSKPVAFVKKLFRRIKNR